MNVGVEGSKMQRKDMLASHSQALYVVPHDLPRACAAALPHTYARPHNGRAFLLPMTPASDARALPRRAEHVEVL